MFRPCPLIALLLCAACCAVGAEPKTTSVTSPPHDWPQWGGSPSRNNASDARGLPVQWSVGEFDRKTGKAAGPPAKNVRWIAKLGTECYGSPVVAGDKVFCATNNGAGYLARYPASVDLGCLLAFRRSDGKFLWQHSAEKLKAGKNIDWPNVGLCSTPLVEGDRLWIVTNRGEVVCLDTNESGVVWSFDMMGRLGSVPRYMSSCSVTAAGDLLLAMTGNGRDLQDKLPAPQAPSFIALDKRSGKLAWADASPGENVLDGQWASPAFAVLGGVPQAIFPGGDGWLYSFEARPSQSGKPGLLWKFDCNPKESVWEGAGAGGRNTIVSAPVIWEGKVYVATGQDPEAGEGQADLWCIDPTRRGNLSGDVGGGVSGDVSTELVVDRQGRPVAPRRRQAVDRQSGEQVRPNPASAVLWHYRGQGSDPAKPGAAKPDAAKSGGSQDFLNVMHRSLGMPAIRDGLLVIGDYSGLVHCLDARTGRVLWVHDMLSAIWGSPLLADGRIYLGNQDGDVVVFALSARLNVLAKNAMGNPIYGTAAAAGDVLYIATQNHLFAIAADK